MTVLLAAACDNRQSGPELLEVCPAPSVPISSIQGDDYQSSMQGDDVSIVGVVTAVTDRGVYVESLEPDGSDRTSEGLFLSTAQGRQFTPGTTIFASG